MTHLVRASALVAGLFAASACGHPCGPTRGRVVRAIDGDTVELETGERIRYLLVNAPESTSKAECFGPEAKRHNAELVEGREIAIAYDNGAASDPARCVDRNGRLLAYVSVGDVEVNSSLVRDGYACVLAIPPAGADREEEFRSLQSAARNRRERMWACETVPSLCN